MPTGDSGSPLATKLGTVESTQVALVDAPAEYTSLLCALPAGARTSAPLSKDTDIAHVLVTRREDLDAQLAKLRQKLRDDAAVWVPWPKKLSKVPTTVTKDVVRTLTLPLGFVDVRFCTVSEIWSGLELVLRKELRGRAVD